MPANTDARPPISPHAAKDSKKEIVAREVMAARSARREVFEALSIHHDKPVFLRPQHIVFVPAAHDADGSLNRRARPVGELLTRERQRNERAAAVRPADLVG